MKSKKFPEVMLIFFFLSLLLLLAGPAYALLGDCNGDDEVSATDVVCMINYLFKDGDEPEVRNDVDVDNCPGVNMGDVHQLVAYLFQAEEIFEPVGTDLVVPSGINIITPWVDGDLGEIVVVDLRINTVDQPNLYGLVIPLSYQNLPDHTEVECLDVDFTGTLLPGGEYSIDPVNDKVLIFDESTGPVLIPAGTDDGLLAHITFEVVAEGDDPTKVTFTYYPPENTVLLISKVAYENGDPPGRMLLPEFLLGYLGNVNGDNTVSISDIVYLIAWLLRGTGSPPVVP
jgi:hypothetical protein